MGELILWTDPAKAQLRQIDQVTAMRILHAVDHYRKTEGGDAIQMRDKKPPEFRLRVGDYRIIFERLAGVLRITAVGHRRDIYR